MSETNSRIEHLLKSLNDSIKKLEENESTYKQTKESCISKIQTDIKQLSFLSDGREMLKDIVSSLYWDTNIAVKHIQTVCVSESGKFEYLIHPRILEMPCRGNCGYIVRERFTSRSSLADFVRNNRSQYAECSDCRKKEELKYKKLVEESQESSRRMYEKIEKRNNDLNQMAWDVFKETPEWINMRNSCFCDNGGKCEMCKAGSVTLYLYPHKDTPQSRSTNNSNVFYKYYLV